MARTSAKDIAFKSGAQWLYQEMQQKLGDKPIEEVDPHIKAEATRRKANEYMVMASIANIKNSVREYYRDPFQYRLNKTNEAVTNEVTGSDKISKEGLDRTYALFNDIQQGSKPIYR